MKKIKLLGIVFAMLVVIYSCERQSIEPDAEKTTFKSGKRALMTDGTPCPYFDDSDCDGVTDALDNCPDSYNPNQEDANGNGVGNVCDTGGGGSNPLPVSGSVVTAEYYYDNYCATTNTMTTGCGLAKGIKEVLLETKDLFKNTTVYEPLEAYFMIDKNNGTDLVETVKDSCKTHKCYVTIKSAQGNNFAIRQANLSYINAKLAYIDELIAQFPNYADHYNAYKSGCTQAFWFSNSSLPVFVLP
jgi:hypothetical protein